MAGTASHTLTDNELYILPSMPTLYLLDKEKHVLLKEALPEQVLSHLAKESQKSVPTRRMISNPHSLHLITLSPYLSAFPGETSFLL